MPTIAYSSANRAKANAQASISGGATSILLTTGAGALFPATFPFQIVVEQYNVSNVVIATEAMTCTNRSGDSLTVTRATEAIPNTPSSLTQEAVARSFDIGLGIVQVTQVFSKKVQDEAIIAIPADLKDGIQKQSFSYATATGAVNTYAITLSPAPVAYTTGMRISFLSNLANTASATVNVNGLGAKTIKKLGGSTDLVSGDIALGMIVECVYDGTNFEMLTPTAPVPQTDINGTASYTTQSDNDAFITYNTGAGANRKETRSQMAKTIRVF